MSTSGISQDTLIIPAAPNPLAYIRLNVDDTVTVVTKSMEAGQGIHTAHATLVAEEIDASASQIRMESAPGEPGVQTIYGNFLMGGIQGTGGQTGVQSSYMMYRMAGAAMRQMILAAAGQRLGAPENELVISSGVVTHAASGRFVSFGDIALDAMKQPVPVDVKPKDASRFTYIGKHFPRVDIKSKTRGQTVYTQDLKLPDMLVAVVERPERLGGKVAAFDATSALKVPGVLHVLEIPSGVAVVASDFWTADKARQLIKIDWNYSDAVRVNTKHISLDLNAMLDEPGVEALKIGDPDAALESAAQRFVADYEVPYQAHASMEPLNGVMQWTDDGIEIWGGSQIFGFDSIFIAQAAGIPIDKIKLNMLHVGGTFGRRYGPEGAVWIELIHIIKAIGTYKPVKLMMTRKDDMSVSTVYYRPAYAHRIEGGVDANGRLIALRHRIVGQSMLEGTLMAQGMVNNGIDFMSVECSVDLPYQIPNQFVDLHSLPIPLKVSPTRFGGTLHNGFSNECFVDEVANAVGQDPLFYRLSHLSESSREGGCLRLAAEKSGWEHPLQSIEGNVLRGRGIAATPSHRSYSACVAEVSVFPDNTWRIDRLVVAIDCGQILNPDNLRSQIEGSAAFAISLARYSEVTIKDGVAQERFFNDYRIARIHNMPKVESYFVTSAQGPSGAGETVGSSIIPAIANALANATGLRIRKIPLRLPGEPLEDWPRPTPFNTLSKAS